VSIGTLTRRQARAALSKCIGDAIEAERADALDLEQQVAPIVDEGWALGRWSDRDIGGRGRANVGREKSFAVPCRLGLRVAVADLSDSEDQLLDLVDAVEQALRGASPYLPRECLTVTEVEVSTSRTDSGAWLYADLTIRGRYWFAFSP
jgi:hypothetical protein